MEIFAPLFTMTKEQAEALILAVCLCFVVVFIVRQLKTLLK